MLFTTFFLNRVSMVEFEEIKTEDGNYFVNEIKNINIPKKCSGD